METSDYVAIRGEDIAIRTRLHDDFCEYGDFTPDEALELAAEIVRQVNELRRQDPQVQALAAILEATDAADDVVTHEDLALAAVQAGFTRGE